MKKCVGCRFAEWNRTKAGRLHPSGDGRCNFNTALPVLPASMFWIPKPCIGGGYINRREEFRDHCPCYNREA